MLKILDYKIEYGNSKSIKYRLLSNINTEILYSWEHECAQLICIASSDFIISLVEVEILLWWVMGQSDDQWTICNMSSELELDNDKVCHQTWMDRWMSMDIHRKHSGYLAGQGKHFGQIEQNQHPQTPLPMRENILSRWQFGGCV